VRFDVAGDAVGLAGQCHFVVRSPVAYSRKK
jgi:hypothetical protein